MPIENFEVKSFQAIGTGQSDADVGVVRVSAALMRQLAKRNSLVRITVMEGAHKGKSLVRIMRAATAGKHREPLCQGEIALQYDDRIALGINNAGTTHKLEIERAGEWRGLGHFLIFHTSPLVRIQTLFALGLMVLGALFGFAIGLAFDWLIGTISG